MLASRTLTIGGRIIVQLVSSLIELDPIEQENVMLFVRRSTSTECKPVKLCSDSCPCNECSQGNTFSRMGGLHSSVVSYAPTILRPRVRIPSKPSTLSSIYIVDEIETVIVIAIMRKGTKIKRGQDWPIFLKNNLTRKIEFVGVGSFPREKREIISVFVSV